VPLERVGDAEIGRVDVLADRTTDAVGAGGGAFGAETAFRDSLTSSMSMGARWSTGGDGEPTFGRASTPTDCPDTGGCTLAKDAPGAALGMGIAGVTTMGKAASAKGRGARVADSTGTLEGDHALDD
jgi:hypothetical protein